MLHCVFGVVIYGRVQGQPPVPVCQDLDTHACQLFQKANPDICNDPLYSETACRRFCGKCPLECYSCPEPVLDPRECNTTALCDSKHTCVSKHVKTSMGEVKHMFTCERIEICNGMTIGFGKRAPELADTAYIYANERAERSVDVICCDTDFCNSPLHVNATKTTTPTQTAISSTEHVATVPGVSITTQTTPTTPTPVALECYSCPEAVLDPSECYITTLCDRKSRCMSKLVRTSTGELEYMFTCERIEICDGMTIGFGKRAHETIEASYAQANQRAERSVNVTCCDTDFCNSPLHVNTTLTRISTPVAITLTTTPTPTSLTSTAPVSTMPACHKDIVFVLDDSGSVVGPDFRHEVEFVRRLITGINVGPNNARVAVMTYSTHPKIEWYLGNYTTKPAVLEALNHVHYQGGWTHLNEALMAVNNKILAQANGDRPAVDNAVVMLTDGRNTANTNIQHAADHLHTASKDVVSIVVGKGINQNTINTIATDRHHVFDIREFTHLHNITTQVLSIICSN